MWIQLPPLSTQSRLQFVAKSGRKRFGSEIVKQHICTRHSCSESNARTCIVALNKSLTATIRNFFNVFPQLQCVDLFHQIQEQCALDENDKNSLPYSSTTLSLKGIGHVQWTLSNLGCFEKTLLQKKIRSGFI